MPLVLAPGECSVHGDIVDLFSTAVDSTLRLEFCDDAFDSIRSFGAGSQRTTARLHRLNQVHLAPLRRGDVREGGRCGPLGARRLFRAIPVTRTPLDQWHPTARDPTARTHQE
ncbi:MAG: hypothetical protein KAI24_14805 [Planctomycetes bacterium]|nr:hypothetical protein [Planctomycetota bacterium]